MLAGWSHTPDSLFPALGSLAVLQPNLLRGS